MKAVIINAPHEVSVEDVPAPEAGPGEVVIKVGVAGICGTDIHILDGEFPLTTYPIIPGHEFGGEVVQVGENVVGVAVGDRVGVDPTLNCGACYFCQRGQGNLCERWNGVGVGSHPGGFAECVAVPARTVYHLPEGMSYAEAALIEPISCVVRGFHRLQPQVGETYLIYGAGPMGLLNAQIARYNGASLVALIDINESRLQKAKDAFGFDVVGTSLDAVREHAPRGFDNVIEATGVTKVAEIAIDAVIRRGKLLLFGVCPPGERAAYDAFKIYNEEITVLGTMAVLNSYGPAVDILSAGAVDSAAMVTHTLPIGQFGEAIDLFRSGAGMKIQIDPSA
ncbi:MAG: zinc-dependent alcohol dehydrogenase family protein [Chloroflexia bacterium]|nr:zinc-dependent alcohol dehydrogenase family protein [Chloroflexia bacterium]MDQ3513055.1 zinc-dependent alcohol dehydrogenase family protein [Chloroflexota bacterium]